MKEEIRLFVLDRGFVIVGVASIYDGLAFHWRLNPGRTVRRWGTTHGLAQLAGGPLAETILDSPASRLVPFRSVIEIIEVNQQKWEQHLISKERSSSPRRNRSSTA